MALCNLSIRHRTSFSLPSFLEFVLLHYKDKLYSFTETEISIFTNVNKLSGTIPVSFRLRKPVNDELRAARAHYRSLLNRPFHSIQLVRLSFLTIV